MVERSVLVQNATGLHARTAGLFVQAAAKFTAQIRVANGVRGADAKSILGALMTHGNAGVLIACWLSGD